MRVAIVVFPGSNCDRDMLHVTRDVYGADASLCWHAGELPREPDAVVLPGGFSYGDRLRAGAIASHSPAVAWARRLAARGTPVLGVCNGFQVLAEAGMLPGVLLPNEGGSFMCGWTELVAENCSTPFTRRLRPGQRVPVPVANGEGRYYAPDDELRRMGRRGQVVFTYARPVNGSAGGVAGVCSEEGNVVGMMPHPERAAEAELHPPGPRAAHAVFESFLGAPRWA